MEKIGLAVPAEQIIKLVSSNEVPKYLFRNKLHAEVSKILDS